MTKKGAALSILGLMIFLLLNVSNAYAQDADDNGAYISSGRVAEDSSGEPIFIDPYNLPKEIRLKDGQELYFVYSRRRLGGGLAGVDVSAFGKAMEKIDLTQTKVKAPKDFGLAFGFKAKSANKRADDAVLKFAIISRITTYSFKNLTIKLLGK